MTSATTNKLDHALALAEKGFRVFPLRPNSKIPPKDMFFKKKATTDPDMIRQWWRENPDYNIGVATGGGTLVVDADVKNGQPGLSALELLDLIGLPDSYRVSTTSGGVHVYLRTEHPHGQILGTLKGFDGIDIKCEGGYVLGPGSTLDGKEYTVLRDAEIEDSPEFFETMLREHAPARKERRTDPMVELDLPENIDKARRWLIEYAPEAIEGDHGDMTTYTVACGVRDRGVSEQTALDLMLEHWNEAKAIPPWEPRDLEAKVASAYRYAQNPPGSAVPSGEFETFDDPELNAPPPSRNTLDVEFDKPSGSKVLKLLDFDAMSHMPEPTWLVDNVIQTQSSALMFGPSNSFKSFMGIDIGLSVATGRPWHGGEVKQTNVLFIATEGAAGVGRKRIPGWFEYHEVAAELRKGVYLLPREISLDDSSCVDLLVDTVKHYKIGLVVLDIFGGTMNGSEIEDTTARTWVRGTNQIIRAGASLLTVAHTGWADKSRARMHTHFWGSFDSRLKQQGDKEALTAELSVERHKDADSLGKWGFRLEACHGTLVPVLDQTAKPQRTKPLSPAQKTALDALAAAITEHGAVKQGAEWPDSPVVEIAKWKAAAIAAGVTTSVNLNSQKSAFNRIKRDLCRLKLIAEHEGHVWANE